MATTEEEILLKLGNLKHLPEFFHDCVNSISKQNTDAFNSISHDTELTPEEIKRGRTKIQKLFRQSAIDVNFSLPCDLPEIVKNTFIKVYKIRQKDIPNSLIKENLINNGHNLVENIDWKVKWILGSSKLATIREPVCQIDFRCTSTEKDGENGATTCKKSINFEANLEKIDELISLLENVKNELDGL